MFQPVPSRAALCIHVDFVVKATYAEGFVVDDFVLKGFAIVPGELLMV
jgi:hypothetical protein